MGTPAVPLNALQVPAKRQLGPRKAATIPKVGRITPLVRAACALLIDGQAKTITEAAQMLNCRREHLSRMLGRAHVEDYYAREEKRKVVGMAAGARAADVFVKLLDCDNAKVKQDVSERILMERGTLSRNNGRGVTINNNVQAAGYIVNLSGVPLAPTIDAEAEAVAA